MKRWPIALVLVASLIASPSIAAVKVGAKCTKVGLVKSASGSQFKCVKKGNKLIWQKSKESKQTAPQTIPNPAPSSTPSVNPQPSPSPSINATESPTVKPTLTPTPKPMAKSKFFQFKYIDGILYRKGDRESEWSKSEKGVIDVNEVRLKAFKEIKSITPPQNLKNSELRISFGQSVNSYYRTAYEELARKSMSYWDPLLLPNTVVPVLLVTELDKSLIRPWLNDFVNGDNDANRFESSLNNYFPSETNRNFSSGGNVTAMFLKSDPERLVGAGFFYYGSSHIDEDLRVDHIAHEITHWYQFVTTPGVPKQNFYQDPNKPGVWLEREIRIGCNLIEGSAVLFGNSILVDNAQWFSDGMDVIVRRVQNQLPGMRLITASDVVAELKKSESWLGSNCSSGYALGALAYEWLVAERGIGIFEKLLKAHITTSNINEAIVKAAGMTRDEFYEKAAPYVLRAWKSALNN